MVLCPQLRVCGPLIPSLPALPAIVDLFQSPFLRALLCAKTTLAECGVFILPQCISKWKASAVRISARWRAAAKRTGRRVEPVPFQIITSSCGGAGFEKGFFYYLQ